MSTATINKRRNSISKDLSYDFPSIQLARTGRFIRLMGRITFVALALSLIAMVFVPWRQTAPGTGEVLALNPQERPQSVKSPAEGIVEEIVKEGLREGSRVTKGELLLKLTPYADGEVEFLRSQVEAANSNVESVNANVETTAIAITMQRAAGESLLLAAAQGLEAAEKKLAQEQNDVAVYEAKLADKLNQEKVAAAVVEQGIIPRQEFVTKQRAREAAENELKRAENKVSGAQAEVREKQRKLEAYEQEIEMKNQLALQKNQDAIQKLAAANQKLLDLRTKQGKIARQEIRAPCSGVIQQWDGIAGSDTVKKGDQLFVIVPETDDLGVEMKVSGNDMPLIKEGDKVRLQFEGWPAVQFVGWPSVAVGTFGGKVSRVFPTDDGKGNFRVLISPDDTTALDDGWPDERYLRQGVRANGWVLLNEVPLGYEIWRQLNGFPPTVSDEEPSKNKKKSDKVKLPKT